MKKIHIATASFGNAENFQKKIPEQTSSEWEISISCYDDFNTSSRINSLHPRTKGKIPKMLEWMKTDADYYIWIDASYTLTSHCIGDLCEKNLEESDLCLFEHPWNKSVKEEILHVSKGINIGDPYLYSRYSGEPFIEQYISYMSDPNFIDDKLFALGFFIYRKELVEKKEYNLMTDWFFHNCYWSIEDQISLPYLIHKHKTKYSTFKSGTIYVNDFASYSL